MRLRPIGLAPGIFAFASMLTAQTSPDSFEVSPFFGYLFGGTVSDFNNSPAGLPVSRWKLTLGDHSSFGLRLGYSFCSGLQPEFEWLRAAPKLQFRIPFKPSDLPVSMDFFLAGISYNFASGRLRPYATVAVGAARLSGADDAQAQFTGKVALGLKIFVTPWLGVRAEAGGYATHLGEDSFGIPCTTFPLGHDGVTPVGCSHESWLLDGNISGGLVFAF